MILPIFSWKFSLKEWVQSGPDLMTWYIVGHAACEQTQAALRPLCAQHLWGCTAQQLLPNAAVPVTCYSTC